MMTGAFTERGGRAATAYGAALSTVSLGRIDEYLRYWGSVRGSELAFAFLSAGQEVERTSFSDLNRRARSIAAGLVSRIEYGEPVLLAYCCGRPASTDCAWRAPRC